MNISVHVRLFIDIITPYLFRLLYAGGYNYADALMEHLFILPTLGLLTNEKGVFSEVVSGSRMAFIFNTPSPWMSCLPH